jgi:G patch domain and KOW motifs-containing protein
MKIGFQISGATKRKKIIDAPIDSDDTKREAVVSMEQGASKVSADEKAKTELVIPLPPPRNPSIAPAVSADDADQLAAQELLNDLTKSDGKKSENTLVIVTKKVEDVKAPLLMANVAPELLACSNDDERFKVDISLRAENMDVNSDLYQNVPIEAFGAAMLRGMGWTGPTEEEESDKKKYDIIPRENRLGLGATAKPPDEKDRRGSKEKKEKAKEEWKRKAEEQLEKQKLYVSFIFYFDHCDSDGMLSHNVCVD